MIRLLWEGGQKSHYGEHYTVENAQIWTLPEESPPILVSGFGPKAIRLGGRVGDGYCGVAPDAELVSLLSSGDGDKPAHAGMKVCWDEDEVRACEIAYRLWPTDALPGELGQELPTTAHYEQAVSLVTEDAVADAFVCGPDPEQPLEAIREYVDAGYDEVYVQQIGPEQEGFFRFCEKEILPKLR